jgi:hypothetical protein
MSHMLSNQQEWNTTMPFFSILTIGIIDMCTKIYCLEIDVPRKQIWNFKRFHLLKRWIETILSLTVNSIIVCINIG